MKNKHPVLRRFMRRKVSVVAAAVLILFVLIAILGPLVWQVDPLKQSVMKKYGPMTVQHPLGTDNLGRDTLARMIYGARVSLAISFAGVLSGALITRRRAAASTRAATAAARNAPRRSRS